MSKRQLVEELHKPARRNFKRRRVIVKGIDDLWQADLVEMIPYAKVNKNYRYLLTVIDCFSKYAWALPLKSKTGVDVTKAMHIIFNEGRHPKNLQTDDGKEFFNSNFQNLMTRNSINHYSTYSIMKASICERFATELSLFYNHCLLSCILSVFYYHVSRFNRTLKEAMWKEFSMNGSYKWLSILPSLILRYNNTIHRTIKMKPVDVNSSNEKSILNSVYKHLKIGTSSPYKVGDFVRISKHKHIFEKGYTPNWTTEIFKVKKVQITSPITYLLEDYKGNPIKGGFYEFELQKAKFVDTYLVEKVLKKKADKIYVKWLGFDKTHNSWINKNNII